MSTKKRAMKQVVKRAEEWSKAWSEKTELGKTWDEAQALVDALDDLENVTSLLKKFGKQKKHE